MIWDKVNSVEDLRTLPPEELPVLAAELREYILDTVSRQGGHLASSLGAVDLILALHYVFNTPEDKLVFDVGHQAYAHKLLSGRKESFARLRELGGCAGFPTPAESPEFDPAVCGHAGTAISVALGLARAGKERRVIAVTGDGSLNCGISLEGLNNSGGCKNLIVILNDNKMSISRNVGSIARYLNTVISGSFYNRMKVTAKRAIRILPRHDLIHRMIRRWEDLLKGLLLPGSFNEVEDAETIASNDIATAEKMPSNASVARNNARIAYERAIRFHEEIIRAEQVWTLADQAARQAVAVSREQIDATFSACRVSSAVVDTVPQAIRIALMSEERRKRTSCRAYFSSVSLERPP